MTAVDLSLREIAYLAETCKKETLYAVENVFLQTAEEDLGMERQKALNTLLQKGFMQMDFDGDVSPSTDGEKMTAFFSDCSAFMQLIYQDASDSIRKKNIWKRDDAFLLADEEADNFHLIYITAEEVQTALTDFFCWDRPETDVGKSATVSQLDLKKAKRYQKTEDYDSAWAVLKQAGVTEKLAELIVAALFEKTEYYSAVYVNLDKEKPLAESCCFSCGDFGYLQICPAIENYRNNAVFTMTNRETLCASIAALVDAFVKTRGDGKCRTMS